MRAALKFVRAWPGLVKGTRHLAWLPRLRYLGAAFQLYRRECRDDDRRRSRPCCGNPALRASCCDRRPTAYPENMPPAELPDLAGLLRPAGVGWGGHVQFFDCTVCGQEWLFDWQPASHGGAQQFKKLDARASGA